MKHSKYLLNSILFAVPLICAVMIYFIHFDLIIESLLVRILSFSCGFAVMLALRPYIIEVYPELRGKVSLLVTVVSSMFFYYLAMIVVLNFMPHNDIIDINKSQPFKIDSGEHCRHIDFMKPDLIFCSKDSTVTDNFFDIHHYNIAGLDVYSLASSVNGELLSNSSYRKFCSNCTIPFGVQYMLETRGFDAIYLFFLYLMNLFFFVIAKYLKDERQISIGELLSKSTRELTELLQNSRSSFAVRFIALNFKFQIIHIFIYIIVFVL